MTVSKRVAVIWLAAAVVWGIGLGQVLEKRAQRRLVVDQGEPMVVEMRDCPMPEPQTCAEGAGCYAVTSGVLKLSDAEPLNCFELMNPESVPECRPR